MEEKFMLIHSWRYVHNCVVFILNLCMDSNAQELFFYGAATGNKAAT